MGQDVGAEIGSRIRALREERGLTQAQLAGLLLKSVETISNFERGKTIPSVLTLAALAGAFNISLAALFDGVGIKSRTARSSPPSWASLQAKLQLLSAKDQKLVLEFAEMLLEKSSSKP